MGRTIGRKEFSYSLFVFASLVVIALVATKMLPPEALCLIPWLRRIPAVTMRLDVAPTRVERRLFRWRS